MGESNPVSDAPAPALKEVLCAMIFAAKEPLTVSGMQSILGEVKNAGNGASDFSRAKENEIRVALDELEKEIAAQTFGLQLVEFADGYRFQTDPGCGPWLKALLQVGRQSRLSRPALETLAIIAYRQPVVRSEIEGVRGVNVDHIIRTLLEAQLIRIAGRSDLPGRPLMYSTTPLFLEHFGLKGTNELPGMEALSRAEADRIKAEEGKRRAEQVLQSPDSEGAAADGPPGDEERNRDDDEDDYDGDDDDV